MSAQGVVLHQLRRHLLRQGGVEATLDVDGRQLALL